jgi:membrane protease YdiL (CAAX protease family)
MKIVQRILIFLSLVILWQIPAEVLNLIPGYKFDFFETIISFMVYLAAVGAVIIITKIRGYADWKISSLYKYKGDIIAGFLTLLFSFFLISFILVFIFGDLQSTGNQQDTGNYLTGLSPFLFSFISAFAAPILEETVFRLAFFEILFPKHSTIALIFSSILFAAIHVSDEITNLLLWLPFLVAGFVLGSLYKKTRKIEVVVAVHMLWNVLQLIILYRS